jgi:hypothetical protein
MKIVTIRHLEKCFEQPAKIRGEAERNRFGVVTPEVLAELKMRATGSVSALLFRNINL